MTLHPKPKKLLGGAENTSKFPPCDFPGCKNPGKCRAPKNNNLREYFNFCEEHAAEYNKNWNYYAGMSMDEIERENKKDIYGRNQTWSFGIKGIRSEDVRKMYFSDPHEIFGKIFGSPIDAKTGKNEMFAPTSEIGKALKVMGLPHTFAMEELKRQYKKLVKKYHPDMSKNENEKTLNEEKFKQLLNAYKKLEKYLKQSSS